MDNTKYTEPIITAFLECSKNVDIAEKTGLSTKTIQRYRNDPELQKIIFERRSQYVETAVNRLNEAMVKAVDTLLEIIENDEIKPLTRLKAIQIMLQSADNLEGMRYRLKSKADSIGYDKFSL